MTSSHRDTGVVFLLPDVNEGWQGRANSLGKLFLNPAVCQCPDLLPGSGPPQRSREMSHSRHEGMSPAGAAAPGSAGGGAAARGEL